MSTTEFPAPMVSVCLTTYMHEPFIAQCIESILAQECNFEFEIIIGEDGSTDNTLSICRKYAEQYPQKIRVFSRSRKDVIFVNGKATGRFNFSESVKVAKGKYIALCEGDDYWCDNSKLQKQVDLMEKQPGIIACHHWQKIATLNAEGKYEEKDAPKEGQGYSPEEITTVRDIFANRVRLKSRTVLFRNIFREGFQFPEWFYKVQFGDVALSMILGKHGDYAFINEPMAVYRMTGSGVSTIGKEDPLFTFRHFMEWIRIWEASDSFFNGLYRNEVVATVMSFYTVIFKKYNYSSAMLRKSVRYALLESGFSFGLRLRMFFGLLKNFSTGKKTQLHSL